MKWFCLILFAGRLLGSTKAQSTPATLQSVPKSRWQPRCTNNAVIDYVQVEWGVSKDWKNQPIYYTLYRVTIPALYWQTNVFGTSCILSNLPSDKLFLDSHGNLCRWSSVTTRRGSDYLPFWVTLLNHPPSWPKKSGDWRPPLTVIHGCPCSTGNH